MPRRLPTTAGMVQNVSRLQRVHRAGALVAVVGLLASLTACSASDSSNGTDTLPEPPPPPPPTVETVVAQCETWYASVENQKFDSLELINQAEAGQLPLADDTLIVKFHATPRLSVSSLLDEPLSTAAIRTLEALPEASYRPLGVDTAHVSTERDADTWEIARILNNDPAVRYVEPNLRLSSLSVDYTGDQWAHTSFGMQEAWNALSTPPGQGVRVAVIDEAFFVSHEDLADNVSSDQWDFADNDNDVTTPFADGMRHGTHVAGIIGALDNGFGVNGVAPASTLVLAKVFKVFENDKNDAKTSDLLKAIQWVSGEPTSGSSAPQISEPVDVINISLGVRSPQHTSEPAFEDLQSVQEALAIARSKGILTFAATGNNGDEPFSASDGVFPPANGPCTIAVGSIDDSRYRSAFSQYSDEAYLVDIMAPGGISLDAAEDENVEGLIFSTVAAAGDTSSYDELAGTSMASPYVAGIAAMIMSENPTWTDEQVLTELLSNTGWAAEFNAYEYGFGVACPDKIMGADTVCGPAPD